MTDTCEGGCACGAVRYRLDSPPMFVHCCHCTGCRRLSGTAFALNAMIETDRLTPLAGQPRPSMLTRESGQTHTQWRCGSCGVLVWGHHPAIGERVAFIPVGTLDAADAFPPALHCYIRSKLPWVTLPDGVPATDGIYDLDACWPADSLARLRAVMGSAAAGGEPAARRIRPGPP